MQRHFPLITLLSKFLFFIENQNCFNNVMQNDIVHVGYGSLTASSICVCFSLSLTHSCFNTYCNSYIYNQNELQFEPIIKTHLKITNETISQRLNVVFRHRQHEACNKTTSDSHLWYNSLNSLNYREGLNRLTITSLVWGCWTEMSDKKFVSWMWQYQEQHTHR